MKKDYKGSSHFCQKKKKYMLMISKTFRKIFCGLTSQKLNFVEGVKQIETEHRANS